MTEKKLKVGLVLVVYNPDTNLLVKCIDSIYTQVSKLILVDNTDQNSIPNYKTDIDTRFNNIEWILNFENRGVANAQNAGLSLLISCDYVILSDQDTIYPEKYVDRMIDFSLKYNSNVTFPTFITRDCVKSVFFYGRGILFFKKKPLSSLPNDKSVEQGIASGSLINNQVLKSSIRMNEDLFIDWVDFEWCWNLKKHGYKLSQSPDIIIRHNLGESKNKILNKEIFKHSPVRHYYILRNALYLVSTKLLPQQYKVGLLIKIVGYYFLYPILFSPHYDNFKHVNFALIDYLRKIKGKIKHI